MTVFANGLEVACKAQANKVIAAFPYVCFTPPQTPATPPGVPVPYPTFGMDSDTDKGTGTVKIGGETVTQKNKSYYTKCTGNEAGCAPKKNLISSVNTGKEYAHAWSGNVKADGEPVSRFSDISTNDHASPQAGGPPLPKIGILDVSDPRCAFMNIKPYDQLTCPEGYEKEHTVEVQFFTAGGVRDLTLKCCENYDDKKAPCICMKAEWVAGEAAQARKAGATGKVLGKKRKTPHNLKSADARNWLKNNPNGKLGDFASTCVNSTVKNQKVSPAKKALATECLEVANMNYMKSSMGKTEKQVKDKKRCQDKCSRAKDQTRLVKVAKNRLKQAAGGDSVVVRASDVAQSKVNCDYTP